MNETEEKVREIIDKYTTNRQYGYITPEDKEKVVKEICQLFELEPDLTLTTKDGLKIGLKEIIEPKLRRLLTFEEVTQIYELWDMATNLIDIDPKESFSKVVGKFWSLIDFGMMVAVEQQEMKDEG